MKLNATLMRAEGFTDAEIQAAEEYVTAAEQEGLFDRTPVVLYPPGQSKPSLVCRTIGEYLAAVNPDCYYSEIPPDMLAELARHANAQRFQK